MDEVVTLSLPVGWQGLASWNVTLCKMLARSGVFTVLPEVRHTVKRKGRFQNFMILVIDGKRIAVDTWDTRSPSDQYEEDFRTGDLSDIKLLIKIQWYPCAYWGRFPVTVKPWTIFPAAEFPLEYFQWRFIPHELLGLITGRNDRFRRKEWVDWATKDGRFYTDAGYRKTLPYPQYLEKLKTCRWGVSLRGKHRNHDGKNRRECEFSSCGMPLAMNYVPHYPFPMEPGKDFYLLKDPESLDELEGLDPREFAEASQRLYRDHFSPSGMARTLVSLCTS